MYERIETLIIGKKAALNVGLSQKLGMLSRCIDLGVRIKIRPKSTEFLNTVRILKNHKKTKKDKTKLNKLSNTSLSVCLGKHC